MKLLVMVISTLTEKRLVLKYQIVSALGSQLPLIFHYTDCSTPDSVFMINSEVEADDEQEERVVSNKRLKPATRRNQLRLSMAETIASKRNTLPRERVSPLLSSGPVHSKKSEPEKRYSSPQRTVRSYENEQKRALQERLMRNHGSRGLEKSVHSLSRSMESLNTGSSSPTTSATPSVKPLPRTPGTDSKRPALPMLYGSNIPDQQPPVTTHTHVQGTVLLL